MDLDLANASNLALEKWAKTVEDQVAMLQRQVQELKTQAEEARAATFRVAELEAKLQEMVARGGEMFI